MKPLTQTHQRGVEHLRQELEALESLVQVCADSVKLCAAPELASAASVLQMTADRAFEASESAKTLETAITGELDSEAEHQAAAAPCMQVMQSDSVTLHELLIEMHTRYTDNQAIDDLFIQAVALAGSIRNITNGGKLQ